MYEELSPLPINKGLYDGLAVLIGQFSVDIQRLAGGAGNELVLQLVNDCVKLLLSDNNRFNQARFRQIIAQYQDVPRETMQRGTLSR